MRLEHYRKLYKSDLERLLKESSKEELILQIFNRYSIRDWKCLEDHLRSEKKGESS